MTVLANRLIEQALGNKALNAKGLTANHDSTEPN